MNQQNRMQERISALEKELGKSKKSNGEKWKLLRVEDCAVCINNALTRISFEGGFHISLRDLYVRVNPGEYLAYPYRSYGKNFDFEKENVEGGELSRVYGGEDYRIYSPNLEYQFRICREEDLGHNSDRGGGRSDPRGDCRDRNLPF
ncbi:MAG: hypothetical protein WCK90_03680 [archaeon]